MIKLDMLTAGLKRYTKNNNEFFTYKHDILQRLDLGMQEATLNNRMVYKKNARLSKIQTKVLLEIFRTTLNKGKGDLFQSILNSIPHSSQLQEI